jgi:DNA-binding NarL/FixJ family response regulator
MPLQPVRVVYADNDPLFRTALVRALIAHEGLELMSLTVDGRSALRAIEDRQPDVALLANDLPCLSGPEIAALLQRSSKNAATNVLLLSEPALRRQRAPEGVRGVLDRAIGPENLCGLVAALGAPTRMASLVHV